MLDKKDELHVQEEICKAFGKGLLYLHILVVFVNLVGIDLNSVRDRSIEDLSGGELQRFACAVVCIQKADV